MASLTRAFSLLIAAQVQALAILGAAWWVGDYLNSNHPISYNWYAVTFPVGVIAVAQTFYVVVRGAFLQEKRADAKKAAPQVEKISSDHS